MADWKDLIDELDRWAETDRAATLWWRDDDAADHGPAAERLLGTAAHLDIPVHLAVIPANETPGMIDAINASPWALVLQHGYAHINHAPKGNGACEIGEHRPVAQVLAELVGGFSLLSEAHPERLLPVLVPPWNRISTRYYSQLPEIGFRAVSLFSARAAKFTAPRLEEISTHCDPVKWKGGPHFTGTGGALDDLISHLTARRTGRADAEEPTGLLTHHLDMDDASWGFIQELVDRTRDHRAARWVSLKNYFAEAA